MVKMDKKTMHKDHLIKILEPNKKLQGSLQLFFLVNQNLLF